MRVTRMFALASVLCIALAVSASDSLRTADSLRAALPLWADSSLAVSDTLSGGRNATDRWYVPLAACALTCAAAWLLFTTRSK